MKGFRFWKVLALLAILAALAVLVGGIGAVSLLLHVIDFQGEDAQSVDSPCRTLGVQPCLGQKSSR